MNLKEKSARKTRLKKKGGGKMRGESGENWPSVTATTELFSKKLNKQRGGGKVGLEKATAAATQQRRPPRRLVGPREKKNPPPRRGFTENPETGKATPMPPRHASERTHPQGVLRRKKKGEKNNQKRPAIPANAKLREGHLTEHDDHNDDGGRLSEAAKGGDRAKARPRGTGHKRCSALRFGKKTRASEAKNRARLGGGEMLNLETAPKGGAQPNDQTLPGGRCADLRPSELGEAPRRATNQRGDKKEAPPPCGRKKIQTWLRKERKSRGKKKKKVSKKHRIHAVCYRSPLEPREG